MLVLQKLGSHKTVGHLFKPQIWIFENFPSFLVLSGAGNKRSKIPPEKQSQRLCSADCTSLERFSFQTASQIFLTFMETLVSSNCRELHGSERKDYADVTELFALSKWVFQHFHFSMWLFCVLFMIFISAVFQNCFLAGCWPAILKLEHQKSFVVSSRYFFNPLPKRSGEVLQIFWNVLGFWMLTYLTLCFYNNQH